MAERVLRMRALLAVGTSAGLLILGALDASAMQSCTGTYSATLLQPLTEPTVVALDLADSSVVPANLSEAFTNGMRAAGVVVAASPTVRLRLSYQVVGQGGSSGGVGGVSPGGSPNTGWSSWSGGGAAALQGGQTLALPDIPNYDAFSPAQPVQSALLNLRAEVRNAGVSVPNWVATLQCTMQGTDNQTLAYQLGYLIGGAIGKQRDNAPV
jgi:hypothetical protein